MDKQGQGIWGLQICLSPLPALMLILQSTCRKNVLNSPVLYTHADGHTPADTPIQGLLLWRIHRASPCTAAGQLFCKGGDLCEENCNGVVFWSCHKEETLIWYFSHWCEPGLFLSVTTKTWISWILGLAFYLLLLSYHRSSHIKFS